MSIGSVYPPSRAIPPPQHGPYGKLHARATRPTRFARRNMAWVAHSTLRLSVVAADAGNFSVSIQRAAAASAPRNQCFPSIPFDIASGRVLCARGCI